MSSNTLLTASCLSQRLVAAVEEVMELVRATVIQYEQESALVRRENQLLSSKLVQITGGLPSETAAESSPTGDEWADWTHHLDQNSGTPADQQNQESDDQDTAYQNQNPSQNFELLAEGPCESVPGFKSDGLSLLPEPALVPPGPPIEAPTSYVSVKTEWTDHTHKPNDQSEQSRDSDVKTEHLLTTRTIKSEPQDTDLFSEIHLVAMESTQVQPAHPGAELESVAMETVAFVERHLEQREAESEGSAVAPPPVTSHRHTSQPITLQPPHSTETRAHNPLAPRPPHSAASAQSSSQPVSGAAPFTHNPPVKPHPLLTAQGRDPTLLPQRHHGNPASTPSPAAGRGRARGRCAVSFPCPQCGKLFVHRSRLRVHMLIHTGEKPYACQRCGKRFNNDGTLKNHQRVHTQLRLYSCPLCAMRFKDAYTCRKHLATHTRRAQAQGGAQNTHNMQDAHTRRTQGSMLDPQDTHARQTQGNALNTHSTRDTHNTHAGRGQRQVGAASVSQVTLNPFMAHTHAAAPQTHTHTHTPSSTLWTGRNTEAGGMGQR